MIDNIRNIDDYVGDQQAEEEEPEKGMLQRTRTSIGDSNKVFAKE